jgi:hypothetical protein
MSPSVAGEWDTLQTQTDKYQLQYPELDVSESQLDVRLKRLFVHKAMRFRVRDLDSCNRS